MWRLNRRERAQYERDRFSTTGRSTICASLPFCVQPCEIGGGRCGLDAADVFSLGFKGRSIARSLESEVVAFYHDLLGLEIKSQSKDFAVLGSGNVGVFLSSTHWDWDEKRPTNARPGWGMYPHFEVADVAATVERARKAGYRIAQEPRKYGWGTEAFVADPDGYVWALVSAPK